MPLTAAGASGIEIDATKCPDELWVSFHRARPRPLASCRSCGQTMHAKVSSQGLRFFAHDRLSPGCPSAGETADHRILKSTLAEAIRGFGWTAELEAQPAAGDVGGWRADVLASSNSGRRIGFEVQLAAMTVAEGRDRTAKYAVDNVEVIWITTKDAHWLMAIPGIKLSGIGSQDAYGSGAPVLLERGAAHLECPSGWIGATSWKPAGPKEFKPFLEAFLSGCEIALEVGWLSESINYGRGQRFIDHDAAIAFVSRQEMLRRDEIRAAIEMRSRAEAERAARQLAKDEEHARNRQALIQRQRRVLAQAVEAAREATAINEAVWVGVPPLHWDAKRPARFEQVKSSEKTGYGLPVWIGPAKDNLKLWAIVCPVASRVSPGLGSSWRRRGTQVWVDSVAEAERIAHSLEWASGQLVIAPG